jgi:Arc/MetJ family transcription regulator
MRTSIDIDGELIAEAHRLSGLSSRREVVNAALSEFVALRRRHCILDLVGQQLIDHAYEVRAARDLMGSDVRRT